MQRQVQSVLFAAATRPPFMKDQDAKHCLTSSTLKRKFLKFHEDSE